MYHKQPTHPSILLTSNEYIKDNTTFQTVGEKSETNCRKQKTSTSLRAGKKFRQHLLKNRGWGLTIFIFIFYHLGFY